MQDKNKYDYMLVTPNDIAYLIVQYRINRRDAAQTIKKIWYGEANRLSALYKTNLKLFVMDTQFIINYQEEANQDAVKSELEENGQLVARNLFNDNVTIYNYSTIINYFKYARLLDLYFPNTYIPKKRLPTLINSYKGPAEKAVNVIKECLKFYSLDIRGPKNKPVNIYYYKGYVYCSVVKDTQSNEQDLDLKEVSKHIWGDLSNLTNKEFWAIFN